MMLANLQVTDYDAAGRPADDDVAVLSTRLSDVLTQELDGASAALGVSADEIMLAAFGRAIARTIGEGIIEVDVPGHGAVVHSVALACVGPNQRHATEMLASVHRAVAAVSLHRAVHGVPADPQAQPLSGILFAFGDTDPARLGHVLELRAYRAGEVLALDWWYDARCFEPYTIEELSEQFPFALIELTSEAESPVMVTAELAMAH
jgi:hypothetical protein